MTSSPSEDLNDKELADLMADPELEDASDGLSDDEELRYGFDPNNPSTLDNMVLDGDLFIASACDTAESEPCKVCQLSVYRSPGESDLAELQPR